jgi:dienelactone hydrolase
LFYFFPGNHMWSQALLRIMFTGGSIGEVGQALPALQAAAGAADADVWLRTWQEIGERLWRRAEGELAAGHRLSARGSFLRSATYLQWAVPFVDHAREDRHALHRRSVDAFGRFAALSDPPIERVEVPYEGTSFPAWYVPPAGATRADRSPAAIYLPGWDSTKEQGILFAFEAARRGVGVLLCDGPGIGEAVLFRGLPNRYDYEVPGGAALDYLANRGDVDPDRIAAVGTSMGGYRVGRFAAFEPRLAGAVAWGAIWDFGAIWRRNQAKPGSSLPTTQSHALHVMGLDSFEAVAREMERWTLDGVADRIRCPLLILHGADDVQIPLSDAQLLYETASSGTKELKVFTAEEGGSAHCQNDNRALAHDYIGDWLRDVLIDGRARSGVVEGEPGRDAGAR